MHRSLLVIALCASGWAACSSLPAAPPDRGAPTVAELGAPFGPTPALADAAQRRTDAARAARRAAADVAETSAPRVQTNAGEPAAVEVWRDGSGRIRGLTVEDPLGGMRPESQTLPEDALTWQVRYSFDADGRTAAIDMDAGRMVSGEVCNSIEYASLAGRLLLDTDGAVVSYEVSGPDTATPDRADCLVSLDVIPVRMHARREAALAALGVDPSSLDWQVLGPPPPPMAPPPPR